MKALKITLLANATFSLLSGLTLILFGKQVASWMGIANPTILLIIGISLIVFEIMVTITAFGKPINQKKVKSIIVQDGLWVIGSIAIIVFQSFHLTFIGYMIIGIVALIVSIFALLQMRHSKS